MPRCLSVLVAIAFTVPAIAQTDTPYYGPAAKLPGARYKVGYEEKIAKNGDWQIDATVRRGDALDMAMYRAAQHARDAGFRYVQFLRATGTTAERGGFTSIILSRGNAATVWARPASTTDAPPGCKPARRGGCYTADVADVLYRLGGAGGAQPGVAVIDHYDKFGRPVQLSGFGIGAVDHRAVAASIVKDGRVEVRSTGTVPSVPSAAMPPASVSVASAGKPTGVAPFLAIPPAAPATAAPAIFASAPLEPASSGRDMLETQAWFEAARAAQQPVRGRDRRQGWTISD